MARGISRRTAMVADRRPLERGLARFLLEERGLFVVGEAATMADVLLQVQQLKPDLVVLHEKLALDHDPTVIAQIRRTSPRTSIALLAANRNALPPELVLLADVVVEDGPGLTELGAAVAGPMTAAAAAEAASETGVAAAGATAAAEAASETGVAAAGATAVARPTRRAGSRWPDRLQGLAMASIIALAFVLARNTATPSLVPTVAGRVHMVAAWDQLSALESALPSATNAQIAEIASALIDERAAAEAAGVDPTTLDQAVRERLASIWSSLPLGTQALLVALFGEIIEASDVPPLPSPSPESEPSPSPESEPSPSPEPEPSPSPEPEPSPSPEPEPSPSPEPDLLRAPRPRRRRPRPRRRRPRPRRRRPRPRRRRPRPRRRRTRPRRTRPRCRRPRPRRGRPRPRRGRPRPRAAAGPPAPPTETSSSPTETSSPPTETTTTPPVGQTQSGALVVVPFGLTLLLAITGWTRRRSNAHKRDRSDVS